VAGVNQYAYVMNSPLNFNDPWGTTPNGVSNTIGSAFPAGSYGAQWNSGVSLGLQPVINGYANTLMATAGTGLLTAAIASVPAALATSSNFWAAIGIAGSQGDAENVAGIGSVSKAATAAEKVIPGEFSIADWSGYPAGVPKPQGPVRLIEGSEYDAARKSANQANNQIRKSDNLRGQPVDIHEIQPIKFGGSPTDPNNKVILDRSLHRQQVTPWWNQLQKDIGG